MPRIFLALVLSCSFFSCKKNSEKGAASDPVLSGGAARAIADKTDTSEVMAVVRLPSGTLDGELAKVVDNIQPGGSGILSSQMPMVFGKLADMDLVGADWSAPVSLVLVNPKKHDKPVVVLFKVQDVAPLETAAKNAGKHLVVRNEWALLGDIAAVNVVQDFAFDTLVTSPEKAVAVIYPPRLVEVYRADIDDALAEMTEEIRQVDEGIDGNIFGVIVDMYKKMLVGMGEQCERMEIRLGTAGTSSELLMKFIPKTGSDFETMIKAQVPGTHHLLAKLPAESQNTVLFSGEVRAGDLGDAMVALSAKLVAAMYKLDEKEAEKVFHSVMDTQTGSFSGTMDLAFSKDTQMPAISINGLYGTTDDTKTRVAWRNMLTLMSEVEKNIAIGGMKIDYTYQANALQIDGVEVDRYTATYDLSNASAQQRTVMESMGPAAMNQTIHMAVFSNVAAVVMNTDSKNAMGKVISSVRKGTGNGFAPRFGEVIQRSKSLGESMIMAVDLESIPALKTIPIPFRVVTMGIGNDAGTLSFRVALGK